jgi:hypothetical protein
MIFAPPAKIIQIDIQIGGQRVGVPGWNVGGS